MSNPMTDREREDFEAAVKRASGLEYLSPYDAMLHGWLAGRSALATEARIREVCLKTANKVGVRLVGKLDPHLKSVIKQTVDAALTEHKENQG